MRDYTTLGIFLKEAREKKGFTQIEVAEILGVHSQFVSNWERGQCAPPEHAFQGLIELLKINRASLLIAMMADAEVRIREKVFARRARSS